MFFPPDVMSNILYRVGVINILENAQKDPNARLPLQDMCKHALDRSQGQLVDLTIVDYGDDDLLLYVADRSSNLRHLEAGWCYKDIYNDWSDALKKFAFLEELSLYEISISEEAIKTAGRYFLMLRTLKVNNRAKKFSDTLSDIVLKAILDSCRHLELLDLCDCLNIDLRGDMMKRCSQQIKCLKVFKDSDEQYDYENDIRFGLTIEPKLHIPDEESYDGSSDDDDDDECYIDDDYDDDVDDGYNDDDGDNDFSNL
nr:hypothetical protein [Tanacetum cinerariifolium]